jgi:hypothetical protein
VARANSSGSISAKGAKTVVIALFTQTSIGPSSRSTACAASSTWSASATSAGTMSGSPPA